MQVGNVLLLFPTSTGAQLGLLLFCLSAVRYRRGQTKTIDKTLILDRCFVFFSLPSKAPRCLAVGQNLKRKPCSVYSCVWLPLCTCVTMVAISTRWRWGGSSLVINNHQPSVEEPGAKHLLYIFFFMCFYTVRYRRIKDVSVIGTIKSLLK